MAYDYISPLAAAQMRANKKRYKSTKPWERSGEQLLNQIARASLPQNDPKYLPFPEYYNRDPFAGLRYLNQNKFWNPPRTGTDPQERMIEIGRQLKEAARIQDKVRASNIEEQKRKLLKAPELMYPYNMSRIDTSTPEGKAEYKAALNAAKLPSTVRTAEAKYAVAHGGQQPVNPNQPSVVNRIMSGSLHQGVDTGVPESQGLTPATGAIVGGLSKLFGMGNISTTTAQLSYAPIMGATAMKGYSKGMAKSVGPGQFYDTSGSQYPLVTKAMIEMGRGNSLNLGDEEAEELRKQTESYLQQGGYLRENISQDKTWWDKKWRGAFPELNEAAWEKTGQIPFMAAALAGYHAKNLNRTDTPMIKAMKETEQRAWKDTTRTPVSFSDTMRSIGLPVSENTLSSQKGVTAESAAQDAKRIALGIIPALWDLADIVPLGSILGRGENATQYIDDVMDAIQKSTGEATEAAVKANVADAMVGRNTIDAVAKLRADAKVAKAAGDVTQAQQLKAAASYLAKRGKGEAQKGVQQGANVVPSIRAQAEEAARLRTIADELQAAVKADPNLKLTNIYSGDLPTFYKQLRAVTQDPAIQREILEAPASTWSKEAQSAFRRAALRSSEQYSVLRLGGKGVGKSLYRGMDTLTGGRGYDAIQAIRGSNWAQKVPILGTPEAQMKREAGEITGGILGRSITEEMGSRRQIQAEVTKAMHEMQVGAFDGTRIPKRKQADVLRAVTLEWSRSLGDPALDAIPMNQRIQTVLARQGVNVSTQDIDSVIARVQAKEKQMRIILRDLTERNAMGDAIKLPTDVPYIPHRAGSKEDAKFLKKYYGIDAEVPEPDMQTLHPRGPVETGGRGYTMSNKEKDLLAATQNPEYGGARNLNILSALANEYGVRARDLSYNKFLNNIGLLGVPLDVVDRYFDKKTGKFVSKIGQKGLIETAEREPQYRRGFEAIEEKRTTPGYSRYEWAADAQGRPVTSFSPSGVNVGAWGGMQGVPEHIIHTHPTVGPLSDLDVQFTGMDVSPNKSTSAITPEGDVVMVRVGKKNIRMVPENETPSTVSRTTPHGAKVPINATPEYEKFADAASEARMAADLIFANEGFVYSNLNPNHASYNPKAVKRFQEIHDTVNKKMAKKYGLEYSSGDKWDWLKMAGWEPSSSKAVIARDLGDLGITAGQVVKPFAGSRAYFLGRSLDEPWKATARASTIKSIVGGGPSAVNVAGDVTRAGVQSLDTDVPQPPAVINASEYARQLAKVPDEMGLDKYTAEELEEMIDQGKAIIRYDEANKIGYGIKYGSDITGDARDVEIFGLFKQGGKPGMGMEQMKNAVREALEITQRTGGKVVLSAYDQSKVGKKSLPEMYAKLGFKEKSRIPWEPEYAPNDYLKGKYPKAGEGYDYVEMEYAPEEALGQAQRKVTRDGGAFKDFFSSVTRGEKGMSNVPYTPVLDITGAEDYARLFPKYAGNFDGHIARSIPGFPEVQAKTATAIAKVYGDGADVLDIAASEGGWSKTITEMTGGRIRTDAVDPNIDMFETYNRTPIPDGARYHLAAFGADEGWEERGIFIPPFKPDRQYDVVHESMGFQFFSEDRAKDLDDVKSVMKPDGVALLEEKFRDELDPAGWAARESKKDSFKLGYYTSAENAAKNKEVIEGMDKNLADITKFEEELRKRWAHVEQYWDSGNFGGYIVSDDPNKLRAMREAIGDTSSEFSMRTGGNQRGLEQLRAGFNEGALADDNPTRMDTDLPYYDEMVVPRPFGDSRYDTVADYIRTEKGREGAIVTMTPDEYLQRVSDTWGIPVEDVWRGRNPELINQYATRMSNGEKAPALVLDYSGYRGEDPELVVLSQEGIHRAVAAKQAGFNKVNVAVITPTNQGVSRELGVLEQLTPQNTPQTRIPVPGMPPAQANLFPQIPLVQGGKRMQVKPPMQLGEGWNEKFINRYVRDLGLNRYGAGGGAIGSTINRTLMPLMTSARPAFMAKNVFGNITNTALTGNMSIDAQMRAARDVLDMASQGGIVPTRLRGAMERGVISPMEYNPTTWFDTSLSQSPLENVPGVGRALRGARHMNSAMESQARLGLYYKYLDEGMSESEAARQVNRVLYNYELPSLNAAEQWLKQFVPFYTFPRRNIPFQIQQLKNPAYWWKQQRALNAIDPNRLEHQEQMAAGRDEQNTTSVKIGDTMVNIPFTSNDAFTFAKNAERSLRGLSAMAQSGGDFGKEQAAALPSQLLQMVAPGTAGLASILTSVRSGELPTLKALAGMIPIVGTEVAAYQRQMKPESMGGDPKALERSFYNWLTGFSQQNYNPYAWEKADLQRRAADVSKANTAYATETGIGIPTVTGPAVQGSDGKWYEAITDPTTKQLVMKPNAREVMNPNPNVMFGARSYPEQYGFGSMEEATDAARMQNRTGLPWNWGNMPGTISAILESAQAKQSAADLKNKLEDAGLRRATVLNKNTGRKVIVYVTPEYYAQHYKGVRVGNRSFPKDYQYPKFLQTEEEPEY